MIRALRSLAAVAIIVRSPNEWAAWSRDLSRLFGGALERALGDTRPHRWEDTP